MNENNDFHTTDEILSDVVLITNDEGFKNGITKGYYEKAVRDAIDELAFDTFFAEMPPYDIAVPESLVLDIPDNCYNIRDVFLFNGDCCDISTSVPVRWKNNFIKKSGQTGYTAKRKDTGSSYDATYPQDRTHTGLYYANIQNGKLMFSSNCANFSKIRLVYDGTSGSMSEKPLIPRPFREVVVDYVSERVLRIFASKERGFLQLQKEAYARLYNPVNGSWGKAKMRKSRMGTWKKNNLKEFNGRLNY